MEIDNNNSFTREESGLEDKSEDAIIGTLSQIFKNIILYYYCKNETAMRQTKRNYYSCLYVGPWRCLLFQFNM